MYRSIVMNEGANPLPESRARLGAVLRASRDVVSIDIAARTLHLNRSRAAQVLARWSKQGWLRRVGPGVYAPVPLDLAGSEQIIADPWVLVPPLFGECYIGGWTAAHHWELTEQLFNETLVFTTQRISANRTTAQGTIFALHHISPSRLFGLTTLWRGSAKVLVSDPARTLVDMLAIPETGGGIDHVADCLKTYFTGRSADPELLLRYADAFNNGAVFKRLGFLAENWLQDSNLAEQCRARLTQGYARLDPGGSTRLVTAWRLWIPERWKGKA